MPAFTLWQVIVTRKHHKLSVKPKLVTWLSTSLDKGCFSVSLLNNGLGPAVINAFEVQVDNKSIKGEGEEPISKALNIIFPNQQYSARNEYITKGYYLGAKERITITRVQFNNFQLSEIQFKHALKRAKLIIDYESLYGEKDSLDSSKEGKI